MEKLLPRAGKRLRCSHFLSKALANQSFYDAGWMRERLTKWIAPLPTGPLVVNLNDNLEVIIDPKKDKGLETALYYHGRYESGTIYILKNSIDADEVFLDVGANIGLLSMAISRVVGQGRVYAFEPVPETFEILKKNIALNQIDNIHLYNFALGDSAKEAMIFANLGISRGSASLLKIDRDEPEVQYPVIVKTLDGVIAEQNIKNIGLLKIDVEGWELNVLKGSKNLLESDKAPILCVEYNTTQPMDGGSTKDLYRYILSVNKYRIFKLLKGKQHPSPLIPVESEEFLPENDNLFCFLPHHINKLPFDLFR